MNLVQEDVGLLVMLQLAKIRPWPYYLRSPVTLDRVLEERTQWYENTRRTLQRVQRLVRNQQDPVSYLALSGDIMTEPPPRLKPIMPVLCTAIDELCRIKEMGYLLSTMSYPSQVFNNFYEKVKTVAVNVLCAYHDHPNREVLHTTGHNAGLIDWPWIMID